MEFFGFTLFGSLNSGALIAVASVIFIVGLALTIKGGAVCLMLVLFWVSFFILKKKYSSRCERMDI